MVTFIELSHWKRKINDLDLLKVVGKIMKNINIHQMVLFHGNKSHGGIRKKHLKQIIENKNQRFSFNEKVPCWERSLILPTN